MRATVEGDKTKRSFEREKKHKAKKRDTKKAEP
jgi:hypothetical protein